MVTVPLPVESRLVRPLTRPPKVTAPEPEAIVPAKPPFKAPPKAIAALVVLKSVFAPSVTGPA